MKNNQNISTFEMTSLFIEVPVSNIKLYVPIVEIPAV